MTTKYTREIPKLAEDRPGYRAELVLSDCRVVAEQMQRGERPRAAFTFLDPPFNIGQRYIGHDDQMPAEEFEDLIASSVYAGMVATQSGGIVAFHGPDKLVDIYLRVLRDAPFVKRLAWVNWYYNFGQCITSNWVDARCHCLIYHMTTPDDKPHTWNPEEVMQPSARATKYNDPRTQTSKTPGMRVPGTVWGIEADGPYWGRVPGNSRERVREVPNQLPELYISRLLKAYTNPGDLVFDMFSGSGTVATVATALRRSVIATDICERNLELAAERIERGAVRI